MGLRAMPKVIFKGAKENRRIFVLLFLIFVGATFIFGSIIFFNKIIKMKNASFLKDKTVSAGYFYTEKIIAAKRALKSITYIYEKRENVAIEEIKRVQRYLPFGSVEYATGGIRFDSEGNSAVCMNDNFYLEGLRGHSGTDVFFDKKTNSNCIIFYIPHFYKGTVKGVFIGLLDSKFLSTISETKFYDEVAESYLCARDGTILGKSGIENDFKNIFVYFSKINAFDDEKEENELKKSFLISRSVPFTFNKNGREANAYLYSEINYPWVYVIVMPESVDNDIINLFRRIIIGIITLIGFILVIFLVYSGTEYRKETERVMIEGKMNLMKAYHMIKCLTNAYRTCIYIDFGKEIVTQIKYLTSSLDENIYNVRKKDEAIKLIEQLPLESQKILYDFINPKTLNDRFAKRNVITAECLNRDDNWIEVSLIASDRDENGNVKTAMLTTHDIDREKKLELQAAENLAEAERANNAKTEFLSRMSHDIRTPLNGIIGMTHIAQNNFKDPEIVKDALGKIDHSSNLLLTLINDVLDLSRIESGRVVMAHEHMNLKEIVDGCLLVLKGYLYNRDLEVKINADDFENPNAFGDELHLRQILLNILSNAIKYTHDGGTVEINTSSKKIDEKKQHFVFSVKDNGIGMSSEFLKRVFEPFSMENSAPLNGMYNGSGLGMPIVKKFTELMNGTVNVQSEKDVGTTVTIEIDFETDDKFVPSEIELSMGSEESVDYSGLKVLLVDDNDLNREVAIYMLNDRNIEVVTAVNGEDAVEKFLASKPGEYDCIFMDVMMPVMNGYEATKNIRAMEQRADAKTIPIIAMTANAFSEDIKEALESGMTTHVSKPVNDEKIDEALIRYVLKKSE